jgi:hypothetical protein
MAEAWVKSIRRQCDAAHVPLFFKQWGGVRESQAGRQLEGRTYDDMPPADIVSGAGKRLAMIAQVASWGPETAAVG